MTEYYHTIEAVTAHLKGVGLTFAIFEHWVVTHDHLIKSAIVNGRFAKVYPASLLRQYIKTHHTL